MASELIAAGTTLLPNPSVEAIDGMIGTLPDNEKIEIYCQVISDLYDRDSFTQGRSVVVFIDPLAGTPLQEGVLFRALNPSQAGTPLLPDLADALAKVIPASGVYFAYAWNVVDTRAGGRVLDGGVLVTLSSITLEQDGEEAVTTASIYYGNLGAMSLQYKLTKKDGSWKITLSDPGAVS